MPWSENWREWLTPEEHARRSRVKNVVICHAGPSSPTVFLGEDGKPINQGGMEFLTVEDAIEWEAANCRTGCSRGSHCSRIHTICGLDKHDRVIVRAGKWDVRFSDDRDEAVRVTNPQVIERPPRKTGTGVSGETMIEHRIDRVFASPSPAPAKPHVANNPWSPPPDWDVENHRPVTALRGPSWNALREQQRQPPVHAAAEVTTTALLGDAVFRHRATGKGSLVARVLARLEEAGELADAETAAFNGSGVLTVTVRRKRRNGEHRRPHRRGQVYYQEGYARKPYGWRAAVWVASLDSEVGGRRRRITRTGATREHAEQLLDQLRAEFPDFYRPLDGTAAQFTGSGALAADAECRLSEVALQLAVAQLARRFNGGQCFWPGARPEPMPTVSTRNLRGAS